MRLRFTAIPITHSRLFPDNSCARFAFVTPPCTIAPDINTWCGHCSGGDLACRRRSSFHLGDGHRCSRRHDRVEIARRLPVHQIPRFDLPLQAFTKAKSALSARSSRYCLPSNPEPLSLWRRSFRLQWRIECRNPAPPARIRSASVPCGTSVTFSLSRDHERFEELVLADVTANMEAIMPASSIRPISEPINAHVVADRMQPADPPSSPMPRSGSPECRTARIRPP